MKKSILLVCCLLYMLFTSCKKTQPSEFLVSEMQTLNELTNPGIRQEYAVNKEITFYVEVSKPNKPVVAYTLKEISKANPDLLITSGVVDKVMTGRTLSFKYTPAQSNVLISLQLRATCGNEVINRFKDFVAK